MFGIRKKVPEPDEARRFLEDAKDGPDQPDPFDRDDRTLADISAADRSSRCDIVNVIVLSFVIVFFGTVFLALTDHQDFSEEKSLTLSRLVSGRYFSDVEKRFNRSLPLRDLLHNADELIGFCFGLDNSPEYKDLKRASDDPYNIEDENAFIPISDSRAYAYEAEEQQTTFFGNDNEPVSETEDNGKNKKLSGITMTTSASSSSSSTSESTTTTTNTREPGATTTTTVPPQTTTRYEDTTTTTAASEPPDTGSSEAEPPKDDME